MIAIDLNKKPALDADRKAIQQTNFTGNIDRLVGAIMFSLLKKQKKPFQIFNKKLWKYCEFILL